MKRIPPMIVCPICQPGVYSYAGTVIAVTCKACREAIERAGK